MPPPRLPFPDPAIPLAQAIANVAGCYPDNAAVTAATRAATCEGANNSDLQALLSLVIAAALCAAKNPEVTCCEADPFIVENLQVADTWTTGTLAVDGEATIMGDVHATGTLCMPRSFQVRHLSQSLILAIDEDGCFKYFPKSDLDPTDLHLPGNLVVDGWTQLASLQQDQDATFAGGWNVLGDLSAAGICVDGLPETEWTDDAHLLLHRNGCLLMTEAGRCCQTLVGCCAPFSFDPDAIGYPDPDIFPQLNPPPGANTTCEIPLYSCPAHPFTPDGWAKTTSEITTSGNIIDSGYAPGIEFCIIYQDNKAAPTPLRTLYYNNDTASWQQAEPTFGSDGNVTYYIVTWYALGYTVGFGSTDPGHEFVKPAYDGGTFDVDHLCPGDS